MERNISISEYDYPLPEEKIAKFPLSRRELSKLLLYHDGSVSQDVFSNIGEYLPTGLMLVFNNTKVIRARLVFYKDTGARIEIFCLEPHAPADYERAFSVKGSCEWVCMVGNLKKWKDGGLHTDVEIDGRPVRLTAVRGGGGVMPLPETETVHTPSAPHGAGVESFHSEAADSAGAVAAGVDVNNAPSASGTQVIRFSWNGDMTFGQLLEKLGKIPIPPYLCRESEEIDNSRYQTVYSKFEGSVAAPTAGLHFTPEIIDALKNEGHPVGEVTLHVGAGTFLPVKSGDVSEHRMHTEHFETDLSTVETLTANYGNIIAVGTTTVRTLESLPAFGWRILTSGNPDFGRPVGQWELYDIPEEYDGKKLLDALADYMRRSGLQKVKTATRIMIMPGFGFRLVNGIITNFHQPKSTLLLLVSAFVGDDWRRIYDYALAGGFRFLSYGDSSLLLPRGKQACL